MIFSHLLFILFVILKYRITEVWITITLEEIRKENFSLSVETTSILKGRDKKIYTPDYRRV